MEEYQELANNDKSKIKWNQVTWYSQTLAIFLGVVIFLSGFWLGSQESNRFKTENEELSNQTVLLTESLKEEKQSVTSLQSEISGLEESNKEILLTSISGFNGGCEVGLDALPEGLYESIELQMIESYQNYAFEVKKTQGASMLPFRAYSLGLFNCTLGDDIFVAPFIYEDTEEEEFPPHRFKVVLFNSSGTIIQEIPKDDGILYRAGYTSGEISEGDLNFTARAIDPCYDTLHTYSLNLETGEFTEEMEGGDDVECWERLNAVGGV